MFTCNIHKERPNYERNTFAVMILSVPDLPREAVPQEGLRLQAIIGCTNDDNGTYGWVELSPNEKQVIGDALNEQNAIPLRWYWCELFGEED